MKKKSQNFEFTILSVLVPVSLSVDLKFQISAWVESLVSSINPSLVLMLAKGENAFAFCVEITSRFFLVFFHGGGGWEQLILWPPFFGDVPFFRSTSRYQICPKVELTYFAFQKYYRRLKV